MTIPQRVQFVHYRAMNPRTQSILKNALLAATLLAAGCGAPDSPEHQVRKVLAAMEAAAEARDTSDVLEHVSTQFRDPSGRGREELARYVRGYFLAHQSVHLITRIESLEFPFEDEARATVLVGMAGTGSTSATWDLAAELYEFRVTLTREGSDWKVTHARWERTGARL